MRYSGGRSQRALVALLTWLVMPFALAACDDDDDAPTGTGSSSRLAFTSDREGGNFDIYSANADGSDVRRLTTSAGEDSDASWSTSVRIAFTSNRAANTEIYTMSADGSDARRLTNNTVRDELPVWSPDGSRIAFASNRDGNFEIYVMNAD